MDMTQYAGSESNYLKASDLGGSTPTVSINSVELLEFDDDDGSKEIKPAVGFQGKEKKLVLNKTNTEALINAFGSQSEDWQGKSVMLSTKFYKTFGREGIVLTPMKDDGPNDAIPF